MAQRPHKFLIQILCGEESLTVEKRPDLTYEEDILQLIHVVNTLGEELSLHLVDDLVHAVSPVGHPSNLFSYSRSLFFLIMISCSQITQNLSN